jgi:hypothetical protein
LLPPPQAAIETNETKRRFRICMAPYNADAAPSFRLRVGHLAPRVAVLTSRVT